jgi:hypothetical protein
MKMFLVVQMPFGRESMLAWTESYAFTKSLFPVTWILLNVVRVENVFFGFIIIII